MTNRPNLINKCSPTIGLSDHETSILHINCHARKTKPIKRQVYMWNRLNIELLTNHDTAEVENFMCNNTTDTQMSHIWASFKGIIETSMKLVPPKMTSTRFTQPWFTRTCKRYSRRKKRTYNRARRTGIQSDWDIFKAVTKESGQYSNKPTTTM